MALGGLVFEGGSLDGLAEDDVLVHAGLDEAASWTVREVRARAIELADVLVAAGLRPGQAVAVSLPSAPSVVAALFGVWRAGGVYVPLNPRYSTDEVGHVLASAEPAVVVRDASVSDAVVAGVADLPVVTWDGASFSPPSSAAVRSEAPARDADIALIQFTSGTTGRPKPVLLKHSGVLELLDGVIAKLGNRSSGAGAERKAPMPNVIPVSLSLWAGIYNVLFAFRVGAPVILMERFDTTAFAEIVTRFGIRSTVLPPAAMAMLSDDTAVETLAPLRFVRSITAPLSPFQARRFHDRFGIAVLNSWGQTEIGGEIVGWNAADSREHGQDKLGSVGRPHQGVQLRIIDGDGVDVPEPGPDATGEVWVLTPALSAGYADGSDLGDRLSDDGWFRTGDTGWVDAEGFLWLAGRVSDMINRGGLKVFPGEVEEVLRASASVADVAVVGMPDDRLGEVPWAFVVPSSSVAAFGDAEVEALLGEARSHLAPYKIPVRVEVVDALPRNEVGKVLVRALREGAQP